jgi:DNA-binding response OmpR family regulator
MSGSGIPILIADDDAFSRQVLEHALVRAGYRVQAVADGSAAWEALGSADSPRVAILDQIMPGVDGRELCRRVRARPSGGYVYLILLTTRGEKGDVVAGLEAGADDYMIKPFNTDELLSRVRAGLRIIDLESNLAGKITELERTLLHVQRLEGLLPICMHCKRIRDERDDWHSLESYMQERSTVVFTHSLCKECAKRHYPDFAA